MTLKTVTTLCSVCEEEITGEIRGGTNGEELCDDCFDDSNLAVCPSCDTTVNCDDLVENPNGENWCGECVNDHCFICDSCGETAWDDDCVEVRNCTRRLPYSHCGTDDNLCSACAASKTVMCVDCTYTVYEEDTYTTADGEEICQSCYDDRYITCDGCGDIVHQDDSYCTDYSTHCENCRLDDGDFSPDGFYNSSGEVSEVGSARCYGLELETDVCDGYSSLEGSLAWGAKDDCTVDGKEFYSDILSGNDGLKAIRELAELADRNNWVVSHSAGYHLHLDMRGESNDSLFAIAYAYRATESVWKSFIALHRLNHGYAHNCRWACADIDCAVRQEYSFYSFACHGTRYNWCNLTAFSVHSTIEIRSHEGTCDEEEICNWVKAHTRFCDWASKLGYKAVKQALDGLDNDEKFAVIVQEVWKDSDLSVYYGEKAKRRNHRFLTKSIGLEPDDDIAF